MTVSAHRVGAILLAALAARGASPAAFDGRCIPAGCVAPPSNIPDILCRRALPAGRLARLGATLDFHHELLALMSCRTAGVSRGPLLSQTIPPRPPLVQPGAPGEPVRVITAEKATDLSRVEHTPADVKFMQGMIGHHAQAIEMVALLRSRTERRDMQLLGRRIDLSQADEIKMMQEWLRGRGQSLPDPHAHHMAGATLMPGMLTAEEMAQLAQAKGAEFDRLFLTLMIKHHLGALTMVEALFATAGAAQESEIFAFASDVVADQRMEIDRMNAMLKSALQN